MKRLLVKRALLGMAMLSMVFVLSGRGHAQTASQEILEKYNASQHVKPEDNKIGFSIERIGKERENSFLIQWKSTSDVIMKSGRNNQFIALLLYFVDADDPDNYKNGLASEFKGNIGSMDNMIVTLDKPAKSLLIYFKGIDKSTPNSEAFLTVPLIFMAELGAAPKLLDTTPRYAGEFFTQLVAKAEKKKEDSKKAAKKKPEKKKAQ